jgi:hypothetical protein
MGRRVRKQFAHQLPLEQLHQRLQQQAERENSSTDPLRFERHGDRYTIHGHYSGFAIQGGVTVTAQTLAIEIELPMLAGLFQGKVERYIDEQAQALLG